LDPLKTAESIKSDDSDDNDDKNTRGGGPKFIVTIVIYRHSGSFIVTNRPKRQKGNAPEPRCA